MKTILVLLALGGFGEVVFLRGGATAPRDGYYIDSAASVSLQQRIRACSAGRVYDAGSIQIQKVDAGFVAPDSGMFYAERQMANQLRLLQDCEAKQIDAGVFTQATAITEPAPDGGSSALGVTALVGVGLGGLFLLIRSR